MEGLTYRFEPITYADVLIMEKWRYNGFEEAIYMDRYHESQDRGDNPLKGPRGSHGYAVFNRENQLFGLFEYYFEDDGVFLGLAINPDFVGRGYSTLFIKDGIEFFRLNFSEDRVLKIEVHRKNIQGIRAYERCGFRLVKRDGDILTYICS